MESFLVGLLFLGVAALCWALAIAAWGPIAIIPLFFGTICFLIIAIGA